MRASLVFIFGFILKEKRFFYLGLLMTAWGTALTWVGPKLIERIIDLGLVPKNQTLTLSLVLILGLSEVFRLLGVFASQLVYAKLGQNVIERVREQMVCHLLKLPIPYFDGVSSGSMMTRVVNDVNSLSDFFQSGFVSILGNVASIFAIFLGLILIHFKLGMLLLFAFLPITLICAFFSQKLQLAYANTRVRLSELNSKLADFLFGMKTVRALGISELKHKELVVQVNRYSQAQTDMVGTFSLFHPLLTLGTGILLLLLIGVGIPLVTRHDLLIGQWVAALSYVILLQQPLVEISDRWNFLLAGLTSIDRIREIMSETTEQMGKNRVPSFLKFKLERVSFNYTAGSNWALENVDLEIKKGDWVGIYGESGSGKSTLLQLLYGFYTPTKGRISWNDENLNELDLRSLRADFGVVEQFPFLFSASVRDNITLFGEHCLDEPSLKAIFKDLPLIESLLCLLDFQVSERGGNLSMGQKQMITFLRAYLARPSIWVLDEATAFFDPGAQQEVITVLKSLNSQHITVIQVAHRPEALKEMKRIIQVHQGQVVEKNLSPLLSPLS